MLKRLTNPPCGAACSHEGAGAKRESVVKRLHDRLSTPDGMRLFKTLVAGKAIALLLLFVVFAGVGSLLGNGAHAADDPHAPAATINAVNTMWTLIAAFLVFAMQIGFTMLEAGFCRSRETVNILMECIADTCLCGILFWAWGFAFMFSAGTPWIGTHWFFLSGAPDIYFATGVPMLAFWLFQFAFADCASTITSGAMAGRTGFLGDLVYSVGVSGFIYPIIGHWAWGPDGWLATMGSKGNVLASLGVPFHDFAGSTVVHTIGGMMALAGAIVLGPRLGRVFKRDGGGPMPAHDLVIAAIGGMILWFGWYGFNPGSTLSGMDFQGISRVATNTTLAACAGGLTAMAVVYQRTKVWDLSFTINGFLAGLVAITCPCYWVNPMGATILGGIAGVVVVASVEMFEWFRLDDPVGAVSVHAICGIWGTLSLGLFACGKFGATGPTGADNSAAAVVTGLFYGGGSHQLIAQLIGSASISLATFGSAFVLMKAVDMLGILRVSKEGELEGLDNHEHGGPAYPEFALNSLGTHVGHPTPEVAASLKEVLSQNPR